MKIEEFRGKSADELKALVAERKKELLNLRFQRASGELQNTGRFAEVRKEIARAMTVLNQINKKKAA
jgi:large subunit ribosomal protein L29